MASKRERRGGSLQAPTQGCCCCVFQHAMPTWGWRPHDRQRPRQRVLPPVPHDSLMLRGFSAAFPGEKICQLQSISSKQTKH